jgi:AraC-like DNA-binding protein
MDPLADVLDLSRVRGALLAGVTARAPWGLALPQSAGAAFHAITSGEAWLRIDGAPARRLQPGDLLLLPTGRAHRLSFTPDAACRPLDRALKERRITADGDLVLDGPGAATTFVCAAYDYDQDFAQSLLSLLPPVIHLPAGDRVAAIVSLLAGERGARDAGARAAVARLIDLLLIHAVRAWSVHAPEPSWLRALHDPLIARVLALLHERPQDPWTIERLAAEVHLSRAALARRFSESVGEPPLTYLTRWRMALAARRLKDTTEPVVTIARGVGYTSEYAFNRAFSRHRGQPPGRYRRGDRAPADLTARRAPPVPAARRC